MIGDKDKIIYLIPLKVDILSVTNYEKVRLNASLKSKFSNFECFYLHTPEEST